VNVEVVFMLDVVTAEFAKAVVFIVSKTAQIWKGGRA
jgi:hypothetical protein